MAQYLYVTHPEFPAFSTRGKLVKEVVFDRGGKHSLTASVHKNGVVKRIRGVFRPYSPQYDSMEFYSNDGTKKLIKATIYVEQENPGFDPNDPGNLPDPNVPFLP